MPRDPHEQKVIDDVERVGWSMIGVRADRHSPAFVYSIGMMHTLDHPEVITFGLDIDLMFGLVNGIGAEIRGGRAFVEPGLYEGLLEGYACKVVPVDESHHTVYLGYAMWHRRHVGKIDTLRAVQVLWPDKVGLFPDEVGCQEHAVRVQPLMSVAG